MDMVHAQDTKNTTRKACADSRDVYTVFAFVGKVIGHNRGCMWLGGEKRSKDEIIRRRQTGRIKPI